jgi:hypothetical protein
MGHNALHALWWSLVIAMYPWSHSCAAAAHIAYTFEFPSIPMETEFFITFMSQLHVSSAVITGLPLTNLAITGVCKAAICTAQSRAETLVDVPHLSFLQSFLSDGLTDQPVYLVTIWMFVSFQGDVSACRGTTLHTCVMERTSKIVSPLLNSQLPRMDGTYLVFNASLTALCHMQGVHPANTLSPCWASLKALEWACDTCFNTSDTTPLPIAIIVIGVLLALSIAMAVVCITVRKATLDRIYERFSDWITSFFVCPATLPCGVPWKKDTTQIKAPEDKSVVINPNLHVVEEQTQPQEIPVLHTHRHASPPTVQTTPITEYGGRTHGSGSVSSIRGMPLPGRRNSNASVLYTNTPASRQPSLTNKLTSATPSILTPQKHVLVHDHVNPLARFSMLSTSKGTANFSQPPSSRSTEVSSLFSSLQPSVRSVVSPGHGSPPRNASRINSKQEASVRPIVSPRTLSRSIEGRPTSPGAALTSPSGVQGVAPVAPSTSPPGSMRGLAQYANAASWRSKKPIMPITRDPRTSVASTTTTALDAAAPGALRRAVRIPFAVRKPTSKSPADRSLVNYAPI